MALRIGLVDLDTSHPADFVPLVRELGHEVVTLVDAGAVRAREYVVRFAREHGVGEVAGTLEELVERCDAVLVLSVDWDHSMAVVERLAEARLPTFLDKPLAGTAGRLRRIVELVESGHRLTGGSALRFAPEIEQWRRRRNGPVRAALVGCWGHPLHYGVHATAMAQAILGPGIVTATALPSEGGIRGLLHHRDGTDVLLEVSDAAGTPAFFASVVTDGGVEHLVPAVAGIYRPLLARSLGYLAGEGPAPVEAGALVEPELTVLALAHSAQRGGRTVELDGVPDDFAPWDGAAFTRSYRQQL